MATVTLSGIHKRYPNDAHAVRGVDLEIADGEFIVLVGPSGCGKSTLLRMVAGLETISEGEITIDGRRINEVSPADRDVAMVFQNYALYPHMTVYKNMAYGLINRGMAKEDIEAKVRETSKLLHIEDYLDRKPGQLSGGQRQRVAMGRAIVRNPKIFLFDEPLSNLDAKLRVQMRIEIKRLQRELGVTSIYVTHDQVEAMTLANRMAVINEGKVEQMGTPIALYERPASTFVAGFIGSPAMNFFDAQVTSDGGSVEIPGGDRFPLSAGQAAPAAGRAVTLGIRPEHLERAEDGAGLAHITVQVVEQLGADTLIHGHFGSERAGLTVRFSGTVALAPDEVLPLHVTPEHLHLFDAETGARLDGD
jgi:sn-glycerol 3-phosphate transport system ATP-binding protein